MEWRLHEAPMTTSKKTASAAAGMDLRRSSKTASDTKSIASSLIVSGQRKGEAISIAFGKALKTAPRGVKFRAG